MKNSQKKKNDTDKVDWFGSVSLFNGISSFASYLMPKPFSEKNIIGTI